MTDANSRQVGGSHYKGSVVQPWDYIVNNGLDYLAGNVVKYVSRFRQKNGVEDLKKARHYLDKLIEVEEAKAACPIEEATMPEIRNRPDETGEEYYERVRYRGRPGWWSRLFSSSLTAEQPPQEEEDGHHPRAEFLHPR